MVRVCGAVSAMVSMWCATEAFRVKHSRHQEASSELLRIVLGGSVARGGPDNEAMEAFRGFPPNGVKFITAAAINPVSGGRSTKKWLAQFGIEAEWIPVYTNNCARRTRDPKYIRMVEEADAIFIGGGQSGRVSSCLFGNYSQSGINSGEETPFLKALQAKKIVGGSSAGAMTQPSSEIIVTGHSAESYEAVLDGRVFERDSGSNLLETSQAVDTHFSERGRQGRLLVFAMQTKQKWAFGVDEGTAYLWRPSGGYQVAGPFGLVVYQDATGSPESQTALMHYLTSGDKIDPTTGQIVFNSDKVPCAVGKAPAGSNSVFDWGTNPYKNVSIATAQAAVGTEVHNYHGKQPVQVTFSKTAETVAMCGPSGESFTNLSVTQYAASLVRFVNTQEPNIPLDYISQSDE